MTFKDFIHLLEMVQTLPQAMQIFGYQNGDIVDERDLRNRWRKATIMKHPDKGGTHEDMVDINNARDLLAKYAGQKLGGYSFVPNPTPNPTREPNSAPKTRNQSEIHAAWQVLVGSLVDLRYAIMEGNWDNAKNIYNKVFSFDEGGSWSKDCEVFKFKDVVKRNLDQQQYEMFLRNFYHAWTQKFQLLNDFLVANTRKKPNKTMLSLITAIIDGTAPFKNFLGL